jgi:hypothetical protein
MKISPKNIPFVLYHVVISPDNLPVEKYLCSADVLEERDEAKV